MEVATYKGWTISVTVTAADLFHDRDMYLLNMELSRRNWPEYLTGSLEDEYPGAHVTVESNEEGEKVLDIDVKVTPPKGSEEMRDLTTVERVTASVRAYFASGNWIIRDIGH